MLRWFGSLVYLFQFHLVRLKRLSYALYGKFVDIFQFHLVRLKQPGKYVNSPDTVYFNSTWSD